jgi:rod shape-determining protein MreD
MNRLVFQNIFRFVLLMLLQIVLLNKINFYGYLNPFVYILFILLLPFETPGWLLLVLSFVIGFTIDIFSGTPGLHTAASLLAGFARPSVIKLVGERDEYDSSMYPSLQNMGLKWFLTYTVILVFLHHAALNFLDVFSFVEFFQTLLRVLVSTIFTVLFIILIEYIFAPRKEKR